MHLLARLTLLISLTMRTILIRTRTMPRRLSQSPRVRLTVSTRSLRTLWTTSTFLHEPSMINIDTSPGLHSHAQTQTSWYPNALNSLCSRCVSPPNRSMPYLTRFASSMQFGDDLGLPMMLESINRDQSARSTVAGGSQDCSH